MNKNSKPTVILRLAAALFLTPAGYAEPVKGILYATEPLVFGKELLGSGSFEAAHWPANVYPLGNSRPGGTVFGEPKKERIQFDEDSMWVGNEHCTGGCQPFGDVYVGFQNMKVGRHGKAS